MKKMVRFELRLSGNLHKKLGEISKRETRSLHAQILHFLQLAVEKYGKEGKEIKID
ncbi:MAG: hypothetical protein HYS08_05055 [Chlamydiae bacterium]|nr:hypothetical protein [Chlamydiota bacterium]MBI3267120.1 hypothetical protein [Chlamydiota bacterium]